MNEQQIHRFTYLGQVQRPGPLVPSLACDSCFALRRGPSKAKASRPLKAQVGALQLVNLGRLLLR